MNITKEQINDGMLESAKNLFRYVFEDNIVKGNEIAINEGIKLIKEFKACTIKTAASNERIEKVVKSALDYIDKY